MSVGVVGVVVAVVVVELLLLGGGAIQTGNSRWGTSPLLSSFTTEHGYLLVSSYGAAQDRELWSAIVINNSIIESPLAGGR